MCCPCSSCKKICTCLRMHFQVVILLHFSWRHTGSRLNLAAFLTVSRSLGSFLIDKTSCVNKGPAESARKGHFIGEVWLQGNSRKRTGNGIKQSFYCDFWLGPSVLSWIPMDDDKTSPAYLLHLGVVGPSLGRRKYQEVNETKHNHSKIPPNSTVIHCDC